MPTEGLIMLLRLFYFPFFSLPSPHTLPCSISQAGNLVADTRYWFRVAAKNGFGSGKWSPVASVVTQPPRVLGAAKKPLVFVLFCPFPFPSFFSYSLPPTDNIRKRFLSTENHRIIEGK